MMQQPSHQHAAIAGFTLIEISIVMVVIGLLLSGGLLAFAPNIQNAKTARTNANMDVIEQALRSYAIRYGCLPCPADGDTAIGGANFGQAVDGGGTAYLQNCSGNATCRADVGGDSVVPWITLGLQEEDITDGWGNRINYRLGVSVAYPVHQQNATAPCPQLGDEATYTAGVCRASTDYPAGDLTVSNAALTINTTTTALYVLISHGPNSAGARAAVSGTTQAGAASAAEAENSNGDTTFVQDAHSEGATVFDDIVRWRSAPDFIESCGDFACGN